MRVEGSEFRESRDSLREEISQNLNENLTEHEVVTETVIYPSAGSGQAPLKIERITDRVRTLESGSKRQNSRVVVRTEVVRDTVYIEQRDSSLQVLGLAKRQSRATAYGLQEDGTPTISGKLSAVSKILKWIFALICAVVVLILVIRFLKTR